MAVGEEKDKREMGEIMPMNPQKSRIIEPAMMPIESTLPSPPKEKPKKTLFHVMRRHSQIRKLYREGKTVKEIMEAVGLSKTSVNDVLRNIKKKKRKPPVKAKQHIYSDQPTAMPPPSKRGRGSRGTAAEYKERVAKIRELHQAGKGTAEIMAEIGCSSTTVNRIVKKPKGRPVKPKPPAPQLEPAPSAPVVMVQPVQKRPVGRPRIHPRMEVIPEQPKKGFWAWIIRLAKYMMERQSRRRLQKAAKMLGITPDSMQALIKRGFKED